MTLAVLPVAHGLTDEQRAMRRYSIGASEIASAIGLNPWRSMHKLWLLKRGLIDDEENVRTRVGTLVEPIIRQIYIEQTGAQLMLPGTLIHPEHSWLTATPDGLVEGESRGLEIKMVGYRSAHHWTDKPDGIPDYYRTQVEQGMAVTGAKEWDVAALIGGTDFRIYRIERDEALWQKMYARARRFWFDYVLTGEPPPADDSDGAREMLLTLFPRSVRPMLPKATPEIEALGESLIAARAASAAAIKREESIENQMRGVIGDSEGVIADTWRATWKTTKAGTRQFLFKQREPKT